MKYKIKFHSKSEDKCYDTAKDIVKTSEDMTETEDIETCRMVLRDYIDVPDYELTDENILGEFGNDIMKSALEQVRNYYGFRRQIYGDLLHVLSKGEVGTFRYEIPYEVNHFELREGKFEDDSKQLEYWIELEILK